MRAQYIFIALFGLLSLVSGSSNAQDSCPADQMRVNGQCAESMVTALGPGWSKIEPGGETACAHDTPYAYWVHPGTRNDLMVYFQGGGGCWNADTCRDTGQEFNGFYDSAVSNRDTPDVRAGMLDLNNPENPFKDYTWVYVPVCTGDIHWGDNVYTYEGDVTIHFKGFVNASAALQWAYDNVSDPDSVFVTGCSAGSTGSILHAPYIIEHYADTPVYQMGDSLSLLFTGSVDLQTDWRAHDHFPQWIPDLADMKPEDWTMAKHYIAVANHYPGYTFSQFNSVRDSVQVFYTYPDSSGDGDDWSLLLETHLDTIQSSAPNYRSFTAGGDQHCVTPRREFYTYGVDGLRFRDWMSDMASGKPVESVHCANCTEPEIIGAS